MHETSVEGPLDDTTSPPEQPIDILPEVQAPEPEPALALCRSQRDRGPSHKAQEISKGRAIAMAEGEENDWLEVFL